MPTLPAPVKKKSDFVRRYRAGEFGNASPTWDTFAEYWASGYNGLVHFRNRVAGGPTYYDVPRRDAHRRYLATRDDGVEEKDLYVSAMAPEDIKIFQGEVLRWYGGHSLFYSCLPLPMRDGLAQDGKIVYGARADFLLRHFLDTNSYEWLHHLLDSYPDHVVEFSTYDKQWGTVPGFNTVFWEVRLY